MTLNVTVLTPKYAFQCADYQITDTSDNSASSQRMQKIFDLNKQTWCATVCFNGVAKFGKVNVENWLLTKVNEIEFTDSFDTFVNKLETANDWLKDVPHPNNRHSFCIAAFVSGKPVFAIISNYEDGIGGIEKRALPKLIVHKLKPTKTKTRVFVSGQSQDVSRLKRKKLEKLAHNCTEPKKIHQALAKLNSEVSEKNSMVSEACFSMHVRATGESSGYAHDSANLPYTPDLTPFGFSSPIIKDIVRERFGEKGGRLSEMHSASWDTSDEFHRIQIREKPLEPDVHNNYGAFLANRGDFGEAKQRFLDAINLDPNHVHTILNLATLEQRDSKKNTIVSSYRKVLRIDPGNEVASLKYCEYLSTQKIHNLKIFEVLNEGIKFNPKSGNLFLYRAKMNLQSKKYSNAIGDYESAREYGADQRLTETGYSLSIAFNGASTEKCIAAYRTALSVNPTNPSLNINLALLLTNEGYIKESELLLDRLIKSRMKGTLEFEDVLVHLPSLNKDMSEVTATLRKILITQFGEDILKKLKIHKLMYLKNEDHYKNLLSQQPNNPEFLIDYGKFFFRNDKNTEAKKKFKQALDIEPNNINGIGNLAILEAKLKNIDEASSLFRKILKLKPDHEETISRYCNLIQSESGPSAQVVKIINAGVDADPMNGRLLILRAEYYLVSKMFEKAKSDYLSARKLGTVDSRIEAGYAQTLHLTGAPIGECIKAYKDAISNSDFGGLKLNLAQLLFLQGEPDDAENLLVLAKDSILDYSAQIELQFYLLAHTNADIKECIEVLKYLFGKGARLNWSVADNIKLVAQSSLVKAQSLETLVDVMKGKQELSLLEDVQEELEAL